MRHKLKFLLFLMLYSVKAFSFDSEPIYFQAYTGIYSLNMVQNKNVFMYNVGLNYMPPQTILILGIENNIHHSKHQYEWPGEGVYDYKRTIDVLSFSCGVNFFKTKRINPILGVILNNSFYWGKAETDNGQLKNYLKSYDHRTNNLCYLLKLNVRVSNKLSIYVSHNFITLKKGMYTGLFGGGLAYNFYKNK